MRLPITITTAALAIASAAGPAQADAATPSTEPQKSTNGVVVLIGANDYGVLAPAAKSFTPPIGTDKGSVTAATPTVPHGIIAILIG